MLLTRLSSVVAAVAVTLALAGCYAVTSHLVHERTREFGIRMALGAVPAAVGRSVLARTIVTTTVAVIAGLGLYAVASRAIGSRLFGVPRLDMPTMALSCALLFASAVVAAWLPAMRATRVDPITALRRE